MTWDTSKPPDNAPTFAVDDYIRELKTDFKTIFSTEHTFPPDGTTITADTIYGKHKEGSGRILIFNTFTPPDGNYGRGILAYCTRSQKLFIRDWGKWIEAKEDFPYDFLTIIDGNFTTETIYTYTQPSEMSDYAYWLINWHGYYVPADYQSKYNVVVYYSRLNGNIYELPADFQLPSGFFRYFNLFFITEAISPYYFQFKILTGGAQVYVKSMIIGRRVRDMVTGAGGGF